MNQRNKVIGEMALNERLTVSQIAKIIGKPATSLYNIQKGKINGISEKLADLILEKFPHYNKVWLLTGEGKMLRDIHTDEKIGDDSRIADDGHDTLPSTLDKAIGEIAEQRKIIAKCQEQIDRLIAVIERMTDARNTT